MGVALNLRIAAKAACLSRQLEDRISKGFTGVEIITFEEQFKEQLDKYERLLNKYSHVLEYVSIHAPSGLTISHATNETHRRNALTCVKELVKLASQIGCRRVVFHGFHHVRKSDSIQEIISLRDKALQNCIKGIKSLDRLCSEKGVTLCLENINACVRLDRLYYLVFSASPFDLLDVVENVNSEAFRLCFDVAHAYHSCNFVSENPEMSEIFRFSELTAETFYKTIAKHVDIVHFTDARGAIGAKGTEHLLPEEGEINFRQMMKTMLESNFSGPIVLEMDELDMNTALNMVKSRDYLLKLSADLSAYLG